MPNESSFTRWSPKGRRLTRRAGVALAGGLATLATTGAIVASAAVPAFPGATNTSRTRGDCRSFQAKTCSRPPWPTTRTFICPYLSYGIDTERERPEPGQYTSPYGGGH